MNLFNLWCSGGLHQNVEETEEQLLDIPKREVDVAEAAKDRESKIQAARERFLARKGKK